MIDRPRAMCGESRNPLISRAVRTLMAAVSLCVLMTGCATVKEVASQTPVISIFVDAHDAYKLVDSVIKDDSMSDEEVRAMMNRPLPKPPGLSYTVALLRRAAAAASLGEVSMVEAAEIQARLNRVEPPFLYQFMELVVYSHAWSGDIKKARKLALDMERIYRLEAKKAGLPANAWPGEHPMLYYVMLSIADALADQQLLNRLLNEYPENLDSLPKLRNKDKTMYLLTRTGGRLTGLIEAGEYDNALHLAQEAERVLEQRADQVFGDDTKGLIAMSIGFKKQLAELASLLRKPEAALKHIATMRSLEKESESPRRARAAVYGAEAVYLASVGQFRSALRKLEEAHAQQLRFLRSGRPSREGYARDKARLQVAAGDYTQALATIDALGPLDSLSVRYYRESAIALRAYARAALGQTQQDLTDLDALDDDMSKRIGTESAHFHFAVKTFAHYKAFRAKHSEAHLRQAVMGGRAFSTAYKRMRSTGQYTDVFTPPELFPRTKEAYLLAVLSALGKFGVTVDELLDAFSLFYDSQTDEDISSAALRTSIPGLSEAEVRHLQNLRLAARKASKHLETVVRHGEPSDIETAAKEMERATRAFEEELKRLKTQSPGFVQALSARSPTPADIRGRLLPSEALVAFAPTQDGTASLVVTRRGVAHHVLPVTAEEVRRLTNRIRRSSRFIRDGNNVHVPPFDTVAANDLYKHLISWTPPHLKGVEQLVIVTRGSLASIPFGLLLTYEPAGRDYKTMQWLIREYAITHAPSIASWVLTNKVMRGGKMDSFIAWADPRFGNTEAQNDAATRIVRRAIHTVSPGPDTTGQQDSLIYAKLLPALPETRAEAEAIARVVKADPVSDVILGSRATRASVLGLSSAGKLLDRSVIMFATHGLAPGDLPWLTQPALAMAMDPESGGMPLLTLDDVVGLRMNADWVLLSACNTSSADSPGGDALSGLARGFFYAGAKSLLVTHWEVETKSAAAITVRTMENYASNTKMTRAQALQAALTSLIEGVGAPNEWSHPAFWAPYALVGNGSR